MTTKEQHQIIAVKLLGHNPGPYVNTDASGASKPLPDFNLIQTVERLIFPELEKRNIGIRIDRVNSMWFCHLSGMEVPGYQSEVAKRSTMSDAIVGAVLKYLEGK